MGYMMDEFVVLGTLSEKINQYVEEGVDNFFGSHNMNHYLFYPLIAIEIGVLQKAPEDIDNLFRRCIAGFLYSNTVKKGIKITKGKINIPGLKKYVKALDQELYSIFQDYRFAREINDINPFSKVQLSCIEDKMYRLTTSWVVDEMEEAEVYFYGADDPDASQAEQKQTFEIIKAFWSKVVLEQVKIEELEENTDLELYNLSREIVEKDLKKWLANVRSNVFNHPKQLSGVLGYLYYRAMLKSVAINIYRDFAEDIYEIANEILLVLNKNKCINEICKISGLRRDKVQTIIDYLVNRGNSNVLEFPLFEVEEDIVTVPSLIRVNDWQFNIINGHYSKGIEISNRENTISKVTEERIDKLLKGIMNIAVGKTRKYVFNNEAGNKVESDIDCAIYDMSQNVVLIIEAKWRTNHYFDEIDKAYGRIFRTLINAYSEQISKHKEFVSRPGSLDFIFKEDTRYVSPKEMPAVYYIAVDKRNQMHIEDKHMISEYMLIYYLNKHINHGELNLKGLCDEINELRTKVKYISSSEKYKEIEVGEYKILVEDGELHLDYL
ncbi:MAG: hypothetical protein IJC02_10325 [Lachnospiraceae bacterium]|nr:hypothetical protein [Lachnospiraceae bacterium]